MNDAIPSPSPLITANDDDNENKRYIAFAVKLNPEVASSITVWVYITADKETGEITCGIHRYPPY